MMKKIFMLLFCCLLVSCVTTTPIVIYKVPEHEVKEDMSIDEYLNKSTEYAIKLKAYIDELINQIIHKANYIDLRKEDNAADTRKSDKDK
jgi:hypothetical protein